MRMRRLFATALLPLAGLGAAHAASVARRRSTR